MLLNIKQNGRPVKLTNKVVVEKWISVKSATLYKCLNDIFYDKQ